MLDGKEKWKRVFRTKKVLGIILISSTFMTLLYIYSNERKEITLKEISKQSNQISSDQNNLNLITEIKDISLIKPFNSKNDFNIYLTDLDVVKIKERLKDWLVTKINQELITKIHQDIVISSNLKKAKSNKKIAYLLDKDDLYIFEDIDQNEIEKISTSKYVFDGWIYQTGLFFWKINLNEIYIEFNKEDEYLSSLNLKFATKYHHILPSSIRRIHSESQFGKDWDGKFKWYKGFNSIVLQKGISSNFKNVRIFKIPKTLNNFEIDNFDHNTLTKQALLEALSFNYLKASDIEYEHLEINNLAKSLLIKKLKFQLEKNNLVTNSINELVYEGNYLLNFYEVPVSTKLRDLIDENNLFSLEVKRINEFLNSSYKNNPPFEAVEIKKDFQNNSFEIYFAINKLKEDPIFEDSLVENIKLLGKYEGNYNLVNKLNLKLINSKISNEIRQEDLEFYFFDKNNKVIGFDLEEFELKDEILHLKALVTVQIKGVEYKQKVSYKTTIPIINKETVDANSINNEIRKFYKNEILDEKGLIDYLENSNYLHKVYNNDPNLQYSNLKPSIENNVIQLTFEKLDKKSGEKTDVKIQLLELEAKKPSNFFFKNWKYLAIAAAVFLIALTGVFLAFKKFKTNLFRSKKCI